MKLIPLVTPWHDPSSLWACGQRSAHSVHSIPVVWPVFPTLSGTTRCVERAVGGREGSTKSHCPPGVRWKGKEIGRVSETAQ